MNTPTIKIYRNHIDNQENQYSIIILGKSNFVLSDINLIDKNTIAPTNFECNELLRDSECKIFNNHILSN